MAAVLLGNPFVEDVVGRSTLLGGGPVLRAGMGAAMADKPARPALRRLGDIRQNGAFRTRLTRAIGVVIDRTGDHEHNSILCNLRYGSLVIQRRLDPRVLVEVLG